MKTEGVNSCSTIQLNAEVYGCVIMASGLGKRFGGNKLMADFEGLPLISHVLSVTEDVFSHRVVVTRHEDVAAYCMQQGIQTILHDRPHRNDTVRLGLEVMRMTKGCMFCQGDQPLLRKETIFSMLRLAKQKPDRIWRPRFEETAASPVLFPNRFYPELLELPEGKGGGWLIKKYPEFVETYTVADLYELMDVDTQEDLERLQQYGKMKRW